LVEERKPAFTKLPSTQLKPLLNHALLISACPSGKTKDKWMGHGAAQMLLAARFPTKDVVRLQRTLYTLALNSVMDMQLFLVALPD
jgi:hypothetical protein